MKDNLNKTPLKKDTKTKFYRQKQIYFKLKSASIHYPKKIQVFQLSSPSSLAVHSICPLTNDRNILYKYNTV